MPKADTVELPDGTELTRAEATDLAERGHAGAAKALKPKKAKTTTDDDETSSSSS